MIPANFDWVKLYDYLSGMGIARGGLSPQEWVQAAAQFGMDPYDAQRAAVAWQSYVVSPQGRQNVGRDAFVNTMSGVFGGAGIGYYPVGQPASPPPPAAPSPPGDPFAFKPPPGMTYMPGVGLVPINPGAGATPPPDATTKPGAYPLGPPSTSSMGLPANLDWGKLYDQLHYFELGQQTRYGQGYHLTPDDIAQAMIRYGFADATAQNLARAWSDFLAKHPNGNDRYTFAQQMFGLTGQGSAAITPPAPGSYPMGQLPPQVPPPTPSTAPPAAPTPAPTPTPAGPTSSIGYDYTDYNAWNNLTPAQRDQYYNAARGLFKQYAGLAGHYASLTPDQQAEFQNANKVYEAYRTPGFTDAFGDLTDNPDYKSWVYGYSPAYAAITGQTQYSAPLGGYPQGAWGQPNTSNQTSGNGYKQTDTALPGYKDAGQIDYWSWIHSPKSQQQLYEGLVSQQGEDPADFEQKFQQGLPKGGGAKSINQYQGF